MKNIKLAEKWLDSIEKAHKLLDCRQWNSANERIELLFTYYPETKTMKHEVLAYLLGLSREAVTRVLNSMNIYRRKAA